MKFHEHLSWWDENKGKLPKGSDAIESYITQIQGDRRDGNAIKATILTNEARWHRLRRPYYKVYPTIMDSLCRLKLDMKYECPEVPEGTIAVRFAEGHEPRTESGIKIGSLLISAVIMVGSKTGKERTTMLIVVNVVDPAEEGYWFMIDTNPEDMNSIEEVINQGRVGGGPALPQHSLYQTSSYKKEVQALTTRIALTVCMLADDPEIITPDVLAVEQSRYDKETDETWKRNAERKAKNKGVFGWSIGKKIEVTPHFRRPHFALRGTGPGKKIPKIVPVKGCVVKYNKLAQVPTGYMLPDGTEVEDGKIAS